MTQRRNGLKAVVKRMNKLLIHSLTMISQWIGHKKFSDQRRIACELVPEVTLFIRSLEKNNLNS